MATLVLKEFRCVEDTTEVGAESPYFITFVGDIGTGETAIRLTRQGNWHNEVDQGEKWTVNEVVADGFGMVPSKTIVLVALVEEDEGLDINGVELTTIKAALATQLNSFKNSGSTQFTAAIRSAMRQNFRNQLAVALASASGDDDDLMGTRILALKAQPGLQPLLNFFQGGGHYRVRYVRQ